MVNGRVFLDEKVRADVEKRGELLGLCFAY